MNWERIRSNWLLVKDKLKERWDKLTDEDLERIAGQRDQLLQRMQERYRILKAEADRRVREWESDVDR